MDFLIFGADSAHPPPLLDFFPLSGTYFLGYFPWMVICIGLMYQTNLAQSLGGGVTKKLRDALDRGEVEQVLAS